MRPISDNNTAQNAAFNEQQRLNIITLQNQHYQMNYNLVQLLIILDKL